MDAEPVSPSLPGNLPPEIWHHIVTFLFWTDRTALKALAQTNQALYPVAATALFRTLHFEFNGGMDLWAREEAKRPWSAPDLPVRCCAFVRAIVVTGHQPWGGGFGGGVDVMSDAQEAMLYYLFGAVKELRQFYWWYETYMPGVILRRLYEVSPTTEVHILSSQVALIQRVHVHQPSRGPPQLACLRSVAAEWYRGEYDQVPNRGQGRGQGRGNVHRPASLKELIVRSPRLTHLSLTGRPTWRRGQRWANEAPGKEEEETAAEIEERGLITLEDGDRLPGTLAHLAFRGMRFGAAQSRLWATELRWEGVRSLSLVEVDWIHLLPALSGGGQLRELVWLELGMPRLSHRDRRINPEAVRQRAGLLEAFLRRLPRTLRTFIGVDLPADMVAVVAEAHGAGLQHLRLRTSSSGDAATLAPAQLYQLPEEFPNLRSLGLSLPSSQYDSDIDSLLIPLRRLPHLHHLELNFGTRQSTPHPDQRPDNSIMILDATNISTLFHRLDIMDGPHLRSCHILHGDWNSLDHPPHHSSQHDAILVAERDRAGHTQVSRLLRWRRVPGLHALYGTPTSSVNLVGRTLEVGGWPGMAGEAEAGLTTTAVAVDMGWGVRDARWGKR
ncbi:hypothetical protein ASPACDRAFT_1859934 [Aspergillus aculeatus ATCC 16872]|uniref:F-box domain-containing protein n=1 Tax=Aspergillus aculeatus (strain ATCC 16872 / CBS 172.66 / WB 5094) TaxID=690307 RepID=A0A1L9WHV3_ASPA1|nr:uncharacterized protein ASPACDRAFT_1859934 [Aspergillus aculeatus ATCC 16872]OJJ95697.1 hypothetical protein ASPACDRAFT_1859934 [Aspergillus aculeatus ATCC 16872]